VINRELRCLPHIVDTYDANFDKIVRFEGESSYFLSIFCKVDMVRVVMVGTDES